MNPRFFSEASDNFEKLSGVLRHKSQIFEYVADAHERLELALKRRRFLERRKRILSGEIEPTDNDFRQQTIWNSPLIEHDTMELAEQRRQQILEKEGVCFEDLRIHFERLGVLEERERKLDMRNRFELT